MSIKKIFSPAIALLLVACAEEAQLKKADWKMPLKLEAVSQAAVTRTTTDIQSTVFGGAEIINAYISVTGASDNTTTLGNPVRLKTAEAVDGINALSPEDGSILYFPPGEDVNLSIYAHYPSSVSLTEPFTVQNPQSGDEAYRLSDLMYASATSKKTDKPVHLQFAHKMAKLIVNATGEEGVTIKKITLRNLYTSINWTPSTGVLGTSSDDLTERKDIVIADEDDYTNTLYCAALFPPQTKSDTYFLEVEGKDKNGKEGTGYVYICEKEFEEGKVYTINMKVGPKNLQAPKEDPSELTNDNIVVIDTWPPTVGTLNIQAVGNLGLKIESLSDDKKDATNALETTIVDEKTVVYSFTYNGKVCEPVPVVSDGKEENPTPLTVADYDVKYYNNLNAGTALIVVTGKKGSEYEGLSTFTTFPIKKASNTMSYPNNNADYETNFSKGALVANALSRPSMQTNEVYGNMTYKLYSDESMTTEYTAKEPVVTIDGNGNVFMQKVGGPIWVKASMDDTGNFEAKTVSYKLTVTQGNVEKIVTIAWDDKKEDGEETWPFTGKAIKPVFQILDNGNTLAGKESSGGVDYNYTFSQNVTVGDNTAVLTITGQGQYSGTKKFYFSITKVDNSFASYNDPTIPIDCGDSKNSPQGDQNQTLTIAPGTHAIAAVPTFGDHSNTDYVGVAGDVTYKVKSGGDYVTLNTTTGVVTGKAKGTAVITASVAGTNNYNALTKDFTVVVEKMTNIFVYNGNTQHVASGSSPAATVPATATYWAQSLGGSVQTCALTLTRKATIYALVVGAGGGCDGSSGSGGLGGYVKASKQYDAGNVNFYVWCGGGGYSDCQGSTTDAIRQYGGWYDGGRPGTTGCSGAGGGVTAVGTANTTAGWTCNANTDTRILVAGAGGGASNGGNGGESGGDKGEHAGTMDISTSGRAKWMGGRANVSGEVAGLATPTSDGGGGGAGFYGGLGGLEDNSGSTKATGGHGGSNYIHSTWKTNSSSGESSHMEFTDLGFTMEKNGHIKNDAGTVTTKLTSCFPGYVIIKYKYDRENE